MEINAVWALVVVVLVELMLAIGRRRKKARGQRVDEYSLSVEDRGGFPVVQLKLKTEERSEAFDLDPNYCHVLSDELLTTSVKALRVGHAPAR